jgi:signal transduction histidine kinase
MIPSDERSSILPRTGLARPDWRDPVLVGAVLVAALLSGYQLGVTLLRPPWLGLSTCWLLTTLAWLAVLLQVLFSRWASRVHLLASRSWWLLSAGMGCYALAWTLQLIGQVSFAGHVPFPWWSDLLFLLQFPCFFLALFFMPSTPARSSTTGLARLRLFFDSLLIMGAVTFLTWEFLLDQIRLQYGPWFPDKVAHLAYPIADLGLLFLLTWFFLLGRRPLAGRAALALLIVAFVCFMIGNAWYAVLLLTGDAQAGDPPHLFWLLGSLCFPLAALVRFRLTRDEPMPRAERPETQPGLSFQRQDMQEGLRFLLPFGAAVLASVLLLVRALVESRAGQDPLGALLLIALLQGLVLLRQGVVWLEQAEIRREREAVRAREQALRETNQQMEVFLGIASHELKTPLTSILLGTERLHRRMQHLLRALTQDPRGAVPQVEAMQTLAETMLQQEGRLNRLVQELLDTSRIQAGRFELHRQPVELAAIVRMAVQEQRLMVPERTILLHEWEREPMVVSADAEHLGQVVTNYLSNALRYSREAAPVQVGVQVEGGQGRVWVRDQGPGIPEGEQERLWERFHRIPGIAVQSGSGVGLGIGLYLSKMIIEQHGGQVGVQSAKGTGSTFWFTLPLVVDEQGQEGSIGQEQRPTGPPAGPEEAGLTP